MVTAERHERILDTLREKGFAEASALAEQLGVSVETIRRDLKALELMNRLTRVRGGASLPGKGTENPQKGAAADGRSMAGSGSECAWYSPAKPPFALCGFPFFEQEGVYRRMQLNPPEPLPKDIDMLSWSPSGGQIRFSAELTCLRIRVRLSRPAATAFNMIPLANAGFDAYASDGDGRYVFAGMTRFNPADDEYEAELFHMEEKRRLDIIVNFPIFTRVESVLIGMDRGAQPLPPPPFAKEEKILVYGGSIMQGFCASRPGMTMPNQLSRRLNQEVVNLGFNGNSRCEREVALAAREIDGVEWLIISPEGNCPDAAFIREHMTEFITLYRERRPEVKIAVMSYMREGRENFDTEALRSRRAKRQCEIEIVESFKNAGDDKIFFWDGESFSSGDSDIYSGPFSAGDEATTDHTHKSDLGFWLMTDGIMRRLSEG